MPLSLFYKDSFDIKYPIKVDMPLNKEIKSKLFHTRNIYFETAMDKTVSLLFLFKDGLGFKYPTKE